MLVPLADGFEDIEAVSIIDVLRRGGVNVVTASLNAETAVVSAHGIRMFADALLAGVVENEYDAIILPGGGDGTENLKKSEILLQRLRRQKAQGGVVAAICAAPLALEAAGVIGDEEVTVYPSCAPMMPRRVSPAPVVADRQVITGQGPGMATLFALAVLARLEGEAAAHRVANGMLTELA